MATTVVRDLMTDTVYTLSPGHSVLDLVETLHEHDIRHVPIVDSEGELLGLVTHRDVLRSALLSRTDLPLNLQQQALTSRTVADLMTADVLTCEAGDELAGAAQSMLDNKLGCLPVVEGTRLVGILTEADFVRYMAERA